MTSTQTPKIPLDGMILSDDELRALAIPVMVEWLRQFDFDCIEATYVPDEDGSEAYVRHLEMAGYDEARFEEQMETARGVVSFADAMREADELALAQADPIEGYDNCAPGYDETDR
jgi:hypothetical protein